MKITKITTYVLRVPITGRRFFSSQCAFAERNSMLVRIDTDAGITGWGEGGQYGPAEPVCSCVSDVLAAGLFGRNPLDKEVLWNEMYSKTRDYGRKGSYIEAISAVDIALWDISARALNVPLSTLLGGRFRDSVPAYATGCYYRGDDYLDTEAKLGQLGDEAKSFVDAGFKMLKMKVGLLSVIDDYRRVVAVRRAIGDDVALFVDANHAYNGYTAVRMGRLLQEQNVLFFEEPVGPEDREGYRLVRGKLNVAIAGGECEFTRYGFKQLFEGDCVDIAQPDICVCGGLSEFLKISTLASTYGVAVLPHVWGSGIALAAALSAIAALPCIPHTANPVPMQNEPAVEYERNFNPLRDELLKEEFSLTGNGVVVPSGPGLGVTVDEAVLERYTTQRQVSEQ